MEWRDPETGQIKAWVWIASGGAVLILFLLVKGISGGQTTSNGTITAPGQNSDITDLLNQMEQELQALQQNQQPPPDPNPNPNPKPKLKSYTVKQGDTWNTIAAKFGMTIDQFFKHNPTLKSLGTPDTIRGGGRVVQVFNVKPTPTPKPTNYTVLKGDTWKSIASKFSLTLPQFYALNPTLPHRPNQIRSGGRTVIVGTSNTH